MNNKYGKIIWKNKQGKKESKATFPSSSKVIKLKLVSSFDLLVNHVFL